MAIQQREELCSFVRQELEDLIFDPQLTLDGCILPFKSNISHLGVSMDSFLQPRHIVEVRIRKFFGEVNAVLGQIGGVCRSDKVWLKSVDMKLFSGTGILVLIFEIMINLMYHTWLVKHFERASDADLG